MESVALIELDTRWLVNAVLAVLVAEAGLLAIYHRFTGRGPRLLDAAPNLLAGFFLLLALRAGMMDSGASSVGMWLAAAGLAHAVDVWRRWPRANASRSRGRVVASPLAEVRRKGTS